MQDQWAKVPLSLLTSVSSSAVVLYACLAAHAHRDRLTCRLSNETIVARSGLSLASVKRAKVELVVDGWIEHDGAQGRGKVPTYRLIVSRIDDAKGLKSDPQRGSDLHHRTEVETEVDTPSLREGDDESEPHMHAAPEEPMFEIEPTAVVPHETPIGHAALKALLDAYGTEPISRPMIGRLGKRFKELAGTYTRDELLAAAESMGARRVANPNAIEAFVLRGR